MNELRKHTSGEMPIGAFIVRYSIYETKSDDIKFYDIWVDDIQVGGISVKEDLNRYFNTFKSQFATILTGKINEKEKVYARITAGVSGFCD